MVDLITTFILVSIGLFVIGTLIGWMIATWEKDITVKMRLRILIGVLVTVMWMMSIVAEIFIPAYTVSALIHGIMGAVVGYLFTEDGISLDLGGLRNGK